MSDNVEVEGEPGEHRADTKTSFILKGEFYDRLKFTAQVLIPGLATFYFTVAQIWGLPKATEIVGTLAALDTLLGLLLGYSSAKFNKMMENKPPDGFLTATGVDPDTGHPNLKMTITKLPSELLAKDTVELKVK